MGDSMSALIQVYSFYRLKKFVISRNLWERIFHFVKFLLGDIDEQRRETYDIERSISNMQNDMIKLNTLLNKEKGTHDNLHQDNILLENDFIMALKVRSQSLPNFDVFLFASLCIEAFYHWDVANLFCRRQKWSR